MPYKSGRHFLQIPGPSNVPDRILRAIDNPTMDHRGPDFGIFSKGILDDLKKIFKTQGPVIIYPASGTGAWEAALVNTLSPGDKVLMSETGQFATLWCELATKLGFVPEFIEGDWRRGAPAGTIEAKLAEDKEHTIKAVCVVHNETSTGVVSNVANVRKALDATSHPALLFVDTISSLASVDFEHDKWQVDVTVSCSQKGLMLPPGLSFNAISEKHWRLQNQILTRGLTGIGKPCWPTMQPASIPTHHQPICYTGSERPSICCLKKGSKMSSNAMTDTPKQPGALFRLGDWKCCAKTRTNIPVF